MKRLRQGAGGTQSDLAGEERDYIFYAAAKSLQSSLTLCDPKDGSPPGSPIHGIFQARVLEWGAIAFSAFVVQKLLSLIRSHLFIFAFISNILGGGS